MGDAMNAHGKFGFDRSLADLLKKEKIPFKENVVLGGIEADFWLRTPAGKEIVVGTKSWEPTRRNMKDGIEMADYYKTATGVEHGYIVIPDMKKGVPSKGLVSKKELLGILKEKFLEKNLKKESAAARSRAKVTRIPQTMSRIVFAAMPFSSAYSNTYFFAMAPAASSVQAKCVRVDKINFLGDIIEEIRNSIRHSIAVIVDLSESLPNVLYEAGFAHAIKKPTVHICSTPLESLPFDVKTWNTIRYDRDRINELKPALSKALRSALGHR